MKHIGDALAAAIGTITVDRPEREQLQAHAYCLLERSGHVLAHEGAGNPAKLEQAAATAAAMYSLLTDLGWAEPEEDREKWTLLCLRDPRNWLEAFLLDDEEALDDAIGMEEDDRAERIRGEIEADKQMIARLGD